MGQQMALKRLCQLCGNWLFPSSEDRCFCALSALLWQYRGVLLEGLVAFRLKIWPCAWSVSVRIPCSVPTETLKTQIFWMVSSASFSVEHCLGNDRLLYCWRSPGCLGRSSSLIHVCLWPAIPLTVTRLLGPECGCLAAGLEAKSSQETETNWYPMGRPS